jgi:hypothetical protein
MSKYDRKIYLKYVYEGTHTKDFAYIDVYDVLVAFDVTCPARQHAIKKLLCAGLRGKGDVESDLRESGEAVNRAIQLHMLRIENAIQRLGSTEEDDI